MSDTRRQRFAARPLPSWLRVSAALLVAVLGVVLGASGLARIVCRHSGAEMAAPCAELHGEQTGSVSPDVPDCCELRASERFAPTALTVDLHADLFAVAAPVPIAVSRTLAVEGGQWAVGPVTGKPPDGRLTYLRDRQLLL